MELQYIIIRVIAIIIAVAGLYIVSVGVHKSFKYKPITYLGFKACFAAVVGICSLTAIFFFDAVPIKAIAELLILVFGVYLSICQIIDYKYEKARLEK